MLKSLYLSPAVSNVAVEAYVWNTRKVVSVSIGEQGFSFTIDEAKALAEYLSTAVSALENAE